MPIRFEISTVQHPYELCMICKDALGCNMFVMEPGTPKSVKFFTCNDHLGEAMKDMGDGIIKMVEEEKKNRE